MKFVTAIPFAALAGAFVLPEPLNRLLFKDRHHDAHAFWDKLPSKHSIASSFADTVDAFSSGIETAVNNAIDAAEHAFDLAGDDPASDLDLADDKPRHPPHPRSNLTIYQLIQKSNHTTKFAELVSKYDSIVKILNSTDANYTLFVPIDAAFEHLPHHKKPSDEFIEKVLKYHIAAGFYPAGRIIATPTLPTVVEEKWLGDKPQRLRTNVGLGGIFVNFYDKIIRANIVRVACAHSSRLPTRPTFANLGIDIGC
jgi:hypothetical protein